MTPIIRYIFLFIFLACASLLGVALYLQEVKHLLPCPLCVAQRVAYWLIGLTALAAWLHKPATWGRRLYSGFLILFSLAGAAVASHHAWLIRYPEATAGCSASPEERFLNALPIAKWWPGMFEANGDCASVTWSFMSLAIPDWSLVWFLILGGVAAYTFFRTK